jgi:hypothetical protein
MIFIQLFLREIFIQLFCDNFFFCIYIIFILSLPLYILFLIHKKRKKYCHKLIVQILFSLKYQSIMIVQALKNNFPINNKFKNHINITVWFFFCCGGRDLNLRPYIYYALSIPTELSSQGHCVIDIWCKILTSTMNQNIFLK